MHGQFTTVLSVYAPTLQASEHFYNFVLWDSLQYDSGPPQGEKLVILVDFNACFEKEL